MSEQDFSFTMQEIEEAIEEIRQRADANKQDALDNADGSELLRIQGEYRALMSVKVKIGERLMEKVSEYAKR